MENKISIIVPCYKVTDFLPQCVESLMNQTYKNIEIILVDDGSPDATGKLCDEYAKKDNLTELPQFTGGKACIHPICNGRLMIMDYF